jgi:phage gp36-like protein
VAYCVKDDILAQISESELGQFTDDGDSGLAVTDGGALEAAYSAGWCRVGGTKFTVVAGSVACADDALNFVYVDSAGAVQADTTLPAGDHYDLALVQTADGAIVLISDLRQASDSDAILAAIADADAEIGGYLGKRYPLPLSPVPTIIRKLSVDLTVWNIMSRRQLGATDAVTKRYDNAIKFLTGVRDGKISLGVADPESTPSTADAPQFTSSPQVFDRTKLGGF